MSRLGIEYAMAFNIYGYILREVFGSCGTLQIVVRECYLLDLISGLKKQWPTLQDPLLRPVEYPGASSLVGKMFRLFDDVRANT